VAHQNAVADIFFFQHIDDVENVDIGGDGVAQQVLPFAKTAIGGGVDFVASGNQCGLDEFPDPSAHATTVAKNISAHYQTPFIDVVSSKLVMS